jgi:hypothetical protein
MTCTELVSEESQAKLLGAVPSYDVASSQHFVVAVVEQAASRADWLEAWATTVGAAGTVGALLYAAVGLARERRTRQQEITRLESEQRGTHEMEARTVVLHDPGCDGTQWIAISAYKVTLGNYGKYPITNVVGELIVRDSKLSVVYGNGGPVPISVLQASQQQTLMWELQRHGVAWPKEMQPHELPSLFKVEVQFTDVHGIRWALRPGLGQQPFRLFDTEALRTHPGD